MPTNYSPTIQKLADTYVDGEQFSTSSDVLLFSLDLLEAFQSHYQSHLEREITSTLSEMERGEKNVFIKPSALDFFFDDLMQGNRLKLDQQQR